LDRAAFCFVTSTRLKKAASKPRLPEPCNG
jgi:hypothetical protein